MKAIAAIGLFLMKVHATGVFEVKLTPQSPSRQSIEKQYHGDLEAIGTGEMLTAVTNVEGSAAYVAIEQVEGTLNGRKGSFLLQHTGTMTRGNSELTISVVPDSGTDQLVGLAGKMTIKIADGKHYYDFEFTLPN